MPGVRVLLADAEKQLQQLEQSAKPTWEGLVQPLERCCFFLGGANSSCRAHVTGGTQPSYKNKVTIA